MHLSKHVADCSNLQESLQNDPNFFERFLKHGFFGLNSLKAATDYIAEKYSCGESEAEEVALSMLRGQQQRNSSRLSNRSGQTTINIPPTTDHPAGRSVPINDEQQVKQTPPPPVSSKLSIDPTPATTKDQKLEDVTKPITHDNETRQQAIIDALQAHKVTGNQFVAAMYGTEFTEENLGKYIGKCIENASSIMASQTATTVKSLVSPLIGDV